MAKRTSVKRTPLSKRIINDVLIRSRRRCPLCYADGIDVPTEGAIAHIIPQNVLQKSSEDNYVFLCSRHHQLLDAAKISIGEVTAARDELYKQLESKREVGSSSDLPPWLKYERTVANILRAEMVRQHGDFFKFMVDTPILGKSGIERNADIAIDYRLFTYPIAMVFEIKYSTRPLAIDEVDSAAAKFADLNISKGVIVSNSGFTESAISLARSNNVGLMIIPEGGSASDADSIKLQIVA